MIRLVFQMQSKPMAIVCEHVSSVLHVEYDSQPRRRESLTEGRLILTGLTAIGFEKLPFDATDLVGQRHARNCKPSIVRQVLYAFQYTMTTSKSQDTRNRLLIPFDHSAQEVAPYRPPRLQGLGDAQNQCWS